MSDSGERPKRRDAERDFPKAQEKSWALLVGSDFRNRRSEEASERHRQGCIADEDYD
jgi:hypothetical protein